MNKSEIKALILEREHIAHTISRKQKAGSGQKRRIRMIFITTKKLNEILKQLESDSADQTKARNVDDFYWRCGNANAVNYIRYKLGMEDENG